MRTLTRLRGTARGAPEGRHPLRRISLVSEGKTIAAIDEGELVMDLYTGGSTLVEAPGTSLVLVGGEPSARKGAWSMLRDRLEATAIARNVLPPYAPAELSVLALQAGHHVEVYGEVLEEEFDEGEAAMREAPRKHPSRVLASIVSVGDDPATAMRAMTIAIAESDKPKAAAPQAVAAPTDPAAPGYRPEWGEWIPTGIGVLVVVPLLASSVAAEDLTYAWRERVTAVLVATLAWSVRPTPFLPEFRSRKAAVAGTGPVAFFARVGFLLGAFLLLYDLSNSPRRAFAPLTLVIASSMILVGSMINELFWNRAGHLLVARLARAPLVPVPDADGRVGACDGTVACRSPVRVADRDAAFGVSETWSRGTRRSASVLEGAELHTQGAFTIETGQMDVTVDPDECLWATTMTETDKRTFDSLRSAWVPVGGRIAAFGHFASGKGVGGQDELRVTSQGTRPALFLATSAKGEPLALARRIVRSRRLTFAGLFVLAAILGFLVVTGPLGR